MNKQVLRILEISIPFVTNRKIIIVLYNYKTITLKLCHTKKL